MGHGQRALRGPDVLLLLLSLLASLALLQPVAAQQQQQQQQQKQHQQIVVPLKGHGLLWPHPAPQKPGGGGAGVGASASAAAAAGTQPIKTVLFVFAMKTEADPFLSALKLKQDEPSKIAPPAPAVTFSGEYKGVRVHVVWSGWDQTYNVDLIGAVPAALAAYLACQAIDPDLIISAGTAGGFKARGAAIGDVFLSSATMVHDRRVQLPGHDAQGLALTNSTSAERLRAALGLKLGVVSSGGSLNAADVDLRIMNGHNAAVKEMEAASVAWVAQLFRKPMFCVKAITDIVDGGKPTHEEFLANFDAAAAALRGALPRVLDFVVGKAVSQL